MTWHEFLNLHPLEQIALSEFAVRLQKERWEHQTDLIEALAKSLSG